MGILEEIKLGIAAALILTIVVLGALWKHAANERDAAVAKVTVLEQVNKDNKVAFDKFKDDTQKAQDITDAGLKKNANTAKKVAKAKQELQDGTKDSKPISTELSGYVDRLRQFHTDYQNSGGAGKSP